MRATWASTTLGDEQTANVYYFHADENAKKIIRLITKSLYEWEMPNLPEDLSFLNKESFGLATSSHEKQCLFILKMIPKLLGLRILKA